MATFSLVAYLAISGVFIVDHGLSREDCQAAAAVGADYARSNGEPTDLTGATFTCVQER